MFSELWRIVELYSPASWLLQRINQSCRSQLAGEEPAS